MTQTNKEITGAAIAAIFKQDAESRAIEREVETYNDRTNKVASAYLQKIIDRALELVGVTPEEIRKMQAEGDAADKKFLESIRPKVEANAKKIAARQQAYVDALRKRSQHRLAGPVPDPWVPIFGFLDTATSIEYALDEGAGIPSQFLSAIGPHQNILRFLVDGNHSNPIYMSFVFSYTPPRDGILSVHTQLIANGSNWWSTQHGCVEAKVHQLVTATLAVYQEGNPDGIDGYQLVNSQTVLKKDYDKHPGCGTDRGANIVDETLTMAYQPATPGTGYPASGGGPLQVLVNIEVTSKTSEGLGQIDFYNSGQMNVPGISFALS